MKCYQLDLQIIIFFSLYYLKNEILRKSTDFQIETINIPGKPFLSLVKYQNLNDIFIKIVKLDKNEKIKFEDNYNNYYEKLIEQIKGYKTVNEWQVKLPIDNDYNRHSVEIQSAINLFRNKLRAQHNKQ